MKFILFLLVSGQVFADTWRVTFQGHSYVFSSDKGLSLESERAKLKIKASPCSDHLRQNLEESFKSWHKPLIENAKDFSSLIKVESKNNAYFVPAGHTNGRKLKLFPDAFAKAVMADKKLCLDKK